tara:strand:+ start:175 stop:444 length:270 start_codon:yes stop_codon:yes gene_type:complete
MTDFSVEQAARDGWRVETHRLNPDFCKTGITTCEVCGALRNDWSQKSTSWWCPPHRIINMGVITKDEEATLFKRRLKDAAIDALEGGAG